MAIRLIEQTNHMVLFSVQSNKMRGVTKGISIKNLGMKYMYAMIPSGLASLMAKVTPKMAKDGRVVSMSREKPE